MRIVTMAFVIFINFILQSTLFSYIEILGTRPNTSLIIIVSYAIMRGDIEGAQLGFFSGLLQDIIFGNVLGIYSLLGFLIGYICGKPFRNFFRENYLLPLILVFFSTLVYDVGFYILNSIFIGPIGFSYYITNSVIPETIYATLLSVPIYGFVYYINKKIEDYEEEKRSIF